MSLERALPTTHGQTRGTDNAHIKPSAHAAFPRQCPDMSLDPAAGEPGRAQLQDLNMLVATSGRERSLDECDALLTAAKLRRHKLIATDSPLNVIDAVAA
jgi:hypothetical protein